MGARKEGFKKRTVAGKDRQVIHGNILGNLYGDYHELLAKDRGYRIVGAFVKS